MADVALALALPVSAKTAPKAAVAASAKADATIDKAAPFATVMAAAKPAANDPLALLKAAGKAKTTKADSAATDDLTVDEKSQDESEATDGGDGATDPNALLSLLTQPAPMPTLQAITPTPAQAQTAAQQMVASQTAQTPLASVEAGSTPTRTLAPGLQPTMAAPKPVTAQPVLADATTPSTTQTANPDAQPQSPAPTTTLTSVSALVAMMTAQDAAPTPQVGQQGTVASTPPTVAALPADVTQLQAAAPQLAAAIAAATKADAPARAADPATASSAGAIATDADASAPQQAAATPGTALATTDDAADILPAAALATQAELATPVAAKPTPALVRNVRTMAPKIGDTVVKTATQQRSEAPKADAAQARSTERAPQNHAALDRADTSSAIAATAQQPQRDAAPLATTSATATIGDASSIEAMTNRQLDLAKGNQWLDSLTRDIVATGGNNANLSFTLSPEHLGALKVDILKGDDGATVNLTTDTDHARTIIQDAQPRLAAEARAQGLTIKETNVSTNSDSSSSQRQQPQSQAAAQQSAGQQQSGQDRRAFAQASSAEPRRPTRSTASDQNADRDLYA